MRFVVCCLAGRLPDGQLGKLRVYAGPEHPHKAQTPVSIDLKPVNRKNARSE